MALTDAQARAAKPRATAYKLPDEGNLVLYVAPTGRKTWRMRYRRDGKESMATLGTYPEVGVSAARIAAAEAKDRLAQGLDPVAASTGATAASSSRRASPRATSTGATTAPSSPTPSPAPTSAVTFAQRFEEFAAARTRWSTAHRSRFLHRMRRDVAPVIGHLHPRDITPALVLKAVAPITARDAIETVHRTVEMIGQTFTYAIAMGDCETNPARGLSIVLPDAPKPVHRPALIDDVGLGHFLDDLWSWPHGGAGQALLQIGLLTAQRPGEVRQMKWSDLDLEAGRWTFDVSKTGLEGHITPLSRQAVGILKAQPRIAGSDYVFPNATTKRPVSDVLVSHLIARLGYAGRMSAHGARAAFRTIGVERLGFPEPAVEMQIAHRPRDIHGAAYNRAIWLHERIQMMQTWADYLDHVRRDAHAKRRGQAPKMAAE